MKLSEPQSETERAALPGWLAKHTKLFIVTHSRLENDTLLLSSFMVLYVHRDHKAY